MEDNISFEKAAKEFREGIEKEHLGPLWENIKHMVTKEPEHEVIPYLWKWESLKKHVMASGKLITPDRGAERRVIYLQNPNLIKKGLVGYATHTLYAGIQLLLPGEVAPSHRHSQTAIRFIIEGEGAFTAVNGEKTYMERGDLILTPAWTWHDHGHEGTEPMIWMDGLDVGLVRSLASSFYEPYPEDTYPVSKSDNDSIAQYGDGMFRPISNEQFYVNGDMSPSPIIGYKWTETQRVLNSLGQNPPDPYDGFAVEYINPSTGGSADPRIGSVMQRLPQGMRTKAHRHVHSAVFHVLEGEGYTVINGTKFEWSKGDFFILPPWSWHEHANTGETDVHLFSFNDKPVMQKLGFERMESFLEGEGHQEIDKVFEPL